MTDKKKKEQSGNLLPKVVKNPDLQTVSADYVESRITGEEVILTFCRRNYDNPLKEAAPLTRVYLTIPHYLRFARMTEENIKKIVDLGIISKEE
ncbi:MAG: hypothetical protein FVQ81_08060 [Candidatus Glassbacteria bacterium]|nr:hypothetical protein [Candidatus Glassbacteria bacterium]